MILDNYIIKMTDPIIDPTQANDATQTQGVFGGSDDVFNNPDLVKPVKQEETTPENTTNVDDFDIHLDDLKISQHVEKEAPVEEKKPEIIEPQIEIETTPEAPKPEIIEQEAETKKIPQAAPHPHPTRTTVVEPQMTTGAKVNPGDQAPTPKQEEPRRPVAKQRLNPQAATTPPVQEVKIPEVAPVSSSLKRKLDELITLHNNINALKNNQADAALEILGANNDKMSILYTFETAENSVSIQKTETDKTDESENTDKLSFVYDEDTQSVQILLDDILLFDEVEHLSENEKKKLQVSEKFNKFIFLVGEQLKKIEKEQKENEAQEAEKRRLQDVFRNF